MGKGETVYLKTEYDLKFKYIDELFSKCTNIGKYFDIYYLF